MLLRKYWPVLLSILLAISISLWLRPAAANDKIENVGKTWDLSPNFLLYSESSYGERSSFVVNQSQMHLNLVHPSSLLAIYGGMSLSQTTNATMTSPENYFAVYPGVTFQPGWSPIAAFAEYWSYATDERKDLRTGIYAYQWLDLPTRFSRNFFTEITGEAIYSSRQNQEVTYSGAAKLGHRFKLTNKFTADAFWEGSLRNNSQDFLPGARATLLFQPFSAAVTGNVSRIALTLSGEI